MWITAEQEGGGNYYYGYYHPYRAKVKSLVYFFSKYPMYMRSTVYPGMYEYNQKQYYHNFYFYGGTDDYTYYDGYNVESYDANPTMINPFIYYYKGDYPLLLTGYIEAYVYYDDGTSPVAQGNAFFENLEKTSSRTYSTSGYPHNRHYEMTWEYSKTSDKISCAGINSIYAHITNASESGNLDDPSAWTSSVKPRADHNDQFFIAVNLDYPSVETPNNYFRDRVSGSQWNSSLVGEQKGSVAGFKLKRQKMITRAVNINNPNFNSYQDWHDYVQENF
jgi:hypothetical protein